MTGILSDAPIYADLSLPLCFVITPTNVTMLSDTITGKQQLCISSVILKANINNKLMSFRVKYNDVGLLLDCHTGLNLFIE